MSNEMYGVVNGLYLCNNDRVEELNERISSRNIPSAPLQPQFSQRPVSTKYAFMPILDRRPKSVIPIERKPIYDIKKTFYPGDATAPWNGYMSNIDTESTLRNQFFALQNCEQIYYVPSSNSELYHVKVDGGKQVQQPFPSLFTEQTFSPFNPNDCNVGQNLWDNCTRQQLYDSDCCNGKCN